MNSTAYAHSGSLGSGPLLVPVVGIPAALAMALVYGYADAYCPIAGWVSLLLVGGYAAGVGTTVGVLGTSAKVRSPGFMTVAGLGLGLVALYAAWAAFEAALLGKGAVASGPSPGYLTLLARPDEVWGRAVAISKHGWYTIGTLTPSGAALWLLWGIEAGAVVVGTTLMAGGRVADRVFCEPCDQWCDDAEPTPQLALPPEGLDGLRPALDGRSEGLAALERLGPAEAGARGLLKVALKRCAGCKQTSTAQLQLVSREVDTQGKAITETRILSPQFLVDPPAFARLMALGAPPRSAPT